MRAVRAAERTRKADDSVVYDTTVRRSPALYRSGVVESIAPPPGVRTVKVTRASKRHLRDLSTTKRSQAETLRSSHKHGAVQLLSHRNVASSRFPMPYPGMEYQDGPPRAKSPGRVRPKSADKKAAASCQKKKKVAIRPTRRREVEPQSKAIATTDTKNKQTRKRPRSARIALTREFTCRRPEVSTVCNQRGHRSPSPKPHAEEGAERTQYGDRKCYHRKAMRPASVSSRRGTRIMDSGALTALSRMADGSYNSPGELRIMKWIVLRETYLDKLHSVVTAARKRANRASKQGVPTRHRSEKEQVKLFNLLVELLTVLRRITVEIVEAIEKWRGPGSNRPFMWGTSNYLVKAAGDVAFLANLPGLEQYLGVSIANNPFLCHARLDGRPAFISSGRGESSRGGKGGSGQHSYGTLNACIVSRSLGVSPERVEAAAQVLFRQVQLEGSTEKSSCLMTYSDNVRGRMTDAKDTLTDQYQQDSDDTNRATLYREEFQRTGGESRMSISNMRRESARSMSAEDKTDFLRRESAQSMGAGDRTDAQDYYEQGHYQDSYDQGHYQDYYEQDLNVVEFEGTIQECVPDNKLVENLEVQEDSPHDTPIKTQDREEPDEATSEVCLSHTTVEPPGEDIRAVEMAIHVPHKILLQNDAPEEGILAITAGEAEHEAPAGGLLEEHDLSAKEVVLADASDTALDGAETQGVQREWIRRGSPFTAIHSMCDGLLAELQANGLGVPTDGLLQGSDIEYQYGDNRGNNVILQAMHQAKHSQQSQADESLSLHKHEQRLCNGQRHSNGRERGLQILANFQGSEAQRPNRSSSQESEDDDDEVDTDKYPPDKSPKRKRKTRRERKSQAFIAWVGRTEARQNYREAKAARHYRRRLLQRAVSAWESHRNTILAEHLAEAFCGQFGISGRFYLRATFNALRIHSRGAHVAARHRSMLIATSERLEVVGRVRMWQAWQRWSEMTLRGGYESQRANTLRKENNMALWLVNDDDERSTSVSIKGGPEGRKAKAVEATDVRDGSARDGDDVGQVSRSMSTAPQRGLGAKLKSIQSFHPLTNKSQTPSFRTLSGLTAHIMGIPPKTDAVAAATGQEGEQTRGAYESTSRASTTASDLARELQLKRGRDREYNKVTAAAACIQRSWCTSHERFVARRVTLSASLIQRIWRLKAKRYRAAGRIRKLWRCRATLRARVLNQALVEAAGAGDLQAVSFLLREKSIGKLHIAKADVNATTTLESTENRTTPLHVASRRGQGLSNGLWLNSTGNARNTGTSCEGNTAGIGAGTAQGINSDWVGVIKALVEAGAAVEAGNGEGLTPMMAAAFGGGGDTVTALAAIGAEVDATEISGCGRTPLVIAAQTANASAAAALLEYGARVNRTIEDGSTPLHEAAGAGSVEVAEMLVRAGAKVDAKTISTKMTPLHLAIANDQHAAVRLLVHSGADVSLADNRGLTPLRLAVEMCDKPTVKLLLAADRPAEVDIEDERGSTELHAACRKGFMDIAQILLDAGANPHSRDREGRTPELVALDFDRGDCAALFYNLAIVPSLAHKRKVKRTSIDHDRESSTKSETNSDGSDRRGDARASSNDDNSGEPDFEKSNHVSWTQATVLEPQSNDRSSDKRSSDASSGDDKTGGVSEGEYAVGIGDKSWKSDGNSLQEPLSGATADYSEAAGRQDEAVVGIGEDEERRWSSAAPNSEEVGRVFLEARADVTQPYEWNENHNGTDELRPGVEVGGADQGDGDDHGVDDGGHGKGQDWTDTYGLQQRMNGGGLVAVEGTEQAQPTGAEKNSEDNWSEYPETHIGDQGQYPVANANVQPRSLGTEEGYGLIGGDQKWTTEGTTDDIEAANQNDGCIEAQYQASETWSSTQAWDGGAIPYQQGGGGRGGQGVEARTSIALNINSGTQLLPSSTTMEWDHSINNKRESYDTYDGNKRESYDTYDGNNMTGYDTHDGSILENARETSNQVQQGQLLIGVSGSMITSDEPELGSSAVTTRKRETNKWSGAARVLKAARQWVALVDEASGHTYYLDKQSGLSQWEAPEDSEVGYASTSYQNENEKIVPGAGSGGIAGIATQTAQLYSAGEDL